MAPTSWAVSLRATLVGEVIWPRGPAVVLPWSEVKPRGLLVTVFTQVVVSILGKGPASMWLLHSLRARGQNGEGLYIALVGPIRSDHGAFNP